MYYLNLAYVLPVRRLRSNGGTQLLYIAPNDGKAGDYLSSDFLKL